jgi:hypothetical protein
MITAIVIAMFLHSPVGLVGVEGSVYGVAPNDITLEVIAAMEQANVGWIRLWINWYQVEHDSGFYDWQNVDSLVNTYTNHGFKLFATLQGGNQFYDTLAEYPPDLYPNPQYGEPPIYHPEALQAWLDFVSTAVTRYGNTIKHWSIWNEPNLQEYWQPSTDSIGYRNLVMATVPVIRSLDPGAKIICGNTSLIDYEYLAAILDTLVQYTDYIGFHPYRRYAEEDQDSLIAAGSIVQPTPMTSFDEEMDSLLSLLHSVDPAGTVTLWNEEAGYPSHPDPILWESVHSCDTVQSKNLLRKYLLDFAYHVEVSTYWGDHDVNSTFYNALGENWVDNFYDMTIADWMNKEYMMLFNYIGISYTPQRDTVWIEAEHYDTLSGELLIAPDSSFIYYPDTCSDTINYNNFAVYTVDLPESGDYTLWMHIQNPVMGKQPVWFGLFDTSYVFIVQTINTTDTLDRFIWSLPFDSELLKVTYWQKGPHFFTLRADTTYTLTIFPLLAGSRLEKIGLKRETPPAVKKLSYTVLENFAEIWDGRWIRDTLLMFQADSGSVPPADWQELRCFAFKDTVFNAFGVAYWLGVPPYDDLYPDYQMAITLWIDSVDTPQLVDFMNGTMTPLGYTFTDSTVTFTNLPVSDVPRFIMLNHNSSYVQELSIRSGSGLSLYVPSHVIAGEMMCTFQIPTTSLVSCTMFDLCGRKVYESSGMFCAGKNEISIPTENLSAGIYFLALSSHCGSCMEKFVLLK